MRGYRLVLLTLAAALALGVGARVLVRVGWSCRAGRISPRPAPPRRLWGRHGSLQRGLGALAGSQRRGALAGGAALVLGTWCWYFVSLALTGPAAVGYVVPVSIAWALVAGAAGPPSGSSVLCGGTATGSRGRRASRCSPAPSPARPCFSREWAGQAASLVLALELFAATTALLLARRRAPMMLTLGLFIVAAVAMAGAEDAARDTVRLVGWSGP